VTTCDSLRLEEDRFPSAHSPPENKLYSPIRWIAVSNEHRRCRSRTSLTNAIAVGGAANLYNLQAREPTGIVPPEQYEEIQNRIGNAFKAINDPVTNEPVFEIIIEKPREADLLAKKTAFLSEITRDFCCPHHEQSGAVRPRRIKRSSGHIAGGKEGICLGTTRAGVTLR
jgi:hypothetical protein